MGTFCVILLLREAANEFQLVCTVLDLPHHRPPLLPGSWSRADFLVCAIFYLLFGTLKIYGQYFGSRLFHSAPQIKSVPMYIIIRPLHTKLNGMIERKLREGEAEGRGDGWSHRLGQNTMTKDHKKGYYNSSKMQIGHLYLATTYLGFIAPAHQKKIVRFSNAFTGNTYYLSPPFVVEFLRIRCHIHWRLTRIVNKK